MISSLLLRLERDILTLESQAIKQDFALLELKLTVNFNHTNYYSRKLIFITHNYDFILIVSIP